MSSSEEESSSPEESSEEEESESSEESEESEEEEKVKKKKRPSRRNKEKVDSDSEPSTPTTPTGKKKKKVIVRKVVKKVPKKKKVVRRVVKKKKVTSKTTDSISSSAPNSPLGRVKGAGKRHTIAISDIFPDTPVKSGLDEFPDADEMLEETGDSSNSATPTKSGKKKKVVVRRIVKKKKKKVEEEKPEELSEEKKKELEELQKASEEEIKTRVNSLLGEMRKKQKPLMTQTLKKMNEHILGFMKTMITDVTDELRTFQIMQKMAELSVREQKIKKKELSLQKREKAIKKKEAKLKVQEEEIAKGTRKMAKIGMSHVAKEYMEIEAQFESIDKGHFSIARDPENLSLNRYANILPYNHTIVKLKSGKYLNANHIDLFGLRFIGCQWPLDTDSRNTEEEFWEMMIDHDVQVIVALQKPKPPKHHYYFPKEKGETKICGKISVFHKSKIEHPFFQVVTCLVKKGAGKIKETAKGLKEVKLCLFLTWPDHDIPKKQHPLFAMIKTARLMNIDIKRAANERREFPIVVHCSAGVGRTGVYIVCDVCIQKNFGMEKVKEVVTEMRKQRYGMIQTVKQYKYVYDLVNKHKKE